MSIIKSIKQVLGLGPNAENHFWDGSVPNQLSLKRGTPDAPGAELIKALNGVLSFPNQGQLLTTNGYIKLPGGMIVQWGSLNVTTTAPNVVVGYAPPFPIPFPNAVLATYCSAVMPSITNQVIQANPGGPTNSLMSFYAVSTVSGVSFPVQWLAIGY